MKKLVLIGAVSALALCGSAYALEIEDNVVPVAVSDAGTTAVSTAVSNALNNNDLLSNNETNTDVASHNSYEYNDQDDIQTDIASHNVDVDDQDDIGSYNDVNSYNDVGSYNHYMSMNEYKYEDESVTISIGDVMLNATLLNQMVTGTGAFAAGGAVMGVAGGFASTGDIEHISLSATKGVIQVNNNTGVASQANSVSLNAKVK